MIGWLKHGRMTWRLAHDDRARACRWFHAHCSRVGTDGVATEQWLSSARRFVLHRMRMEANTLERAVGGDSVALDLLIQAPQHGESNRGPAYRTKLPGEAHSTPKTPIFERMRRGAEHLRKSGENEGAEELRFVADALERQARDEPAVFDRCQRVIGLLVRRLMAVDRELRQADATGGLVAAERLMGANDNGIWETAWFRPFVSDDPIRAMLAAAAGLERSASLLEKMRVGELRRLQSPAGVDDA